MMRIKCKLIEKLQRKTINQGIRICVDCGSILTLMDQTKIRCRECGSTRRINKQGSNI